MNIQKDDTLFGHPKGLYILFFTEMWERFSYYGMRSLLVFYMTKQLLFSHGEASRIYGLYTGLVYFTPLLGGIMADRWLGQRKSVVVGGVLMAIGHFLMAFESLFFIALIFLILGNGAFKPNISTQVGGLYPPGDSRRDRAFNIFYLGINLGAFMSPLFCGAVGEIYGWHYGFTLAGFGMILGLAVYLAGERHLVPVQEEKKAAVPVRKNNGSGRFMSGEDRHRLFALMSICIFVIVFWIAYEQQGNTLALWADEDTDRHIGGWEIPATLFQSLNPLFIFLCTPLVTRLWAWQSRKGREPDSILKMSIGCILLGISFLIMIPAARLYMMDGTPVSMWWLVISTLVLTIGELYLSPIGLSLVTKLAPLHMVSMMMGVWFLSQFAGNFLAGYLGSFWDVMAKTHFFGMLSILCAATGMGILLYRRRLKRTDEKLIALI
jgi:POT family proton-dependent oligopeptide transporter